jgi:hypothetical protein
MVGNSDDIGGCRRLGSVVGGGTVSAVGEVGEGGLPMKDEGGRGKGEERCPITRSPYALFR